MGGVGGGGAGWGEEHLPLSGDYRLLLLHYRMRPPPPSLCTYCSNHLVRPVPLGELSTAVHVHALCVILWG